VTSPWLIEGPECKGRLHGTRPSGDAGWAPHPTPLPVPEGGSEVAWFQRVAVRPEAKYVLPKDLPVNMSRGWG
jgi:hypothetical protein